MKIRMDGWIKALQASGLAAQVLLISGCAGFDESGFPGSAASMARDQMMLIREQPQSFGHFRLMSLTRLYPDLGVFLAKKGMPDFLAETSSDERNYFILYYLRKRQAFACRTRSSQVGVIEFAGPYPVTDREFRILDGFRTRSHSRMARPLKVDSPGGRSPVTAADETRIPVSSIRFDHGKPGLEYP